MIEINVLIPFSGPHYDRRSRLVAVVIDGRGGVEYAYDGTGRRYQSRRVTALAGTLYNITSGVFQYRAPAPKPGIDTGTPNKTYMTGGNDGVIALDHQDLDAAGNPIRAIHWAAYHSDSNGLEAEAATKDYVQTSTYAWFDKADRLTAAADYGTNNADFTGATLPTRPSSAPASSDTVLVTGYAYNMASRIQTVTDPKGVATRTTTDALGRTTRTQETLNQIEERGTLAVYDGLSNTIKLVADLDNNGQVLNTTDQVTQYTYGSSSDATLLTETAYPDKQTSSDVVAFTYHLDGLPNTRTDQRGAVLTFDYDNRRRMTEQDLTTVGSADASTGKIAYSYDASGRREKITSYDNITPSVINEIQYAYTDYGALKTEYQAHDGVVSTSTSPRVDYLYDETAPSGAFTKALRPTDIIYPASTDTDLTLLANRRNIKLNYATGVSDDIGRPSEIRDDDNTDLASYTYLGDGTVVSVDYDQPTLRLDYKGAGSPYSGFDRFGRVVDHHWIDLGAASTRDRIKYGYDRNGNRTYRQNVTPFVSGQDELYAYDKLNRLTQFGRGTLPGTFDHFEPADEEFRQTWSLDDLGNWNGYQEHEIDGTGQLILQLDQTRSHNDVNEIDTDDNDANAAGASITATTGTNWFDPTYDAAGNMTAFPKPSDPASGYTAVYDAWNRLVEVKDGTSGDTVAKYEYDGVGRRIVKDVYVSGSHDHYRHYYYTIGWQVIEERIDSGTLADRQYVWGLRYVDELILRDRDADSGGGGNLGVTGSGLDERVYCIQDAHFNVTTITNTGGDAVERYRYTPYGERTVLNTSYNTQASSNYDCEIGHQGLMYDKETKLIQNRNRYLHPGLGRFLQQDQLEYIDGMNLYRYVQSNPLILMDPTGHSWFGFGRQVLGGLFYVGPWDAYQAYFGYGEAAMAFGNRWGNSADEQNALRHCLLAALLTQNLTADDAEQTLLIHESLNDQRGCDTAKDHWNNATGSQIGKNSQTPEKDCLKALNDGDLMVSDKDAMDAGICDKPTKDCSSQSSDSVNSSKS